MHRGKHNMERRGGECWRVCEEEEKGEEGEGQEDGRSRRSRSKGGEGEEKGENEEEEEEEFSRAGREFSCGAEISATVVGA